MAHEMNIKTKLLQKSVIEKIDDLDFEKTKILQNLIKVEIIY